MLRNEHVGKRVVIRVRLAGDVPGRRFTDILGELIEVNDAHLVVDRDGETITLDRSTVVAGKPIPPKPPRRRPRQP